MTLAHVGFAVTLIGIVVTSHLSIERDVRLTNGASTQLGALTFTLVAVDRVRGPNYLADRGTVRVDGDGESYVLFPEKRRYLAGGNVMTEAAIDAGVTRDMYVAMGEPHDDGAGRLRLHYKPLVRWVWVGALLMALGGLIAVTDARYRRLRVRRDVAVGAESERVRSARRRRHWRSAHAVAPEERQCARMSRASLFIPLTAFVVIVALLYAGFSLNDPHQLPSALIGKPFPGIRLAVARRRRGTPTERFTQGGPARASRARQRLGHVVPDLPRRTRGTAADSRGDRPAASSA